MRFVITQIINETKNHTLYLACLFMDFIELRSHHVTLILGNIKMTLEFRCRPKRVLQKLNKFLVRVTINPPEIVAMIDTAAR